MRITTQNEGRRRFHRRRPARFIQPTLAHLEYRVLLSGSVPLMPSNTVSSESAVLYDNPAVPPKEITLINNTSQTVYPILTDANSQPAPEGPSRSMTLSTL